MPTVSAETRRRPRSARWVTKTDLIGFVRCPYAWWLLDQGEITLDDTLGEFQFRLMAEGSEFQASVEAGATPFVVPSGDFDSVLTSDKKLLATPMFENRKLGIYGRPDGLHAAGGALIPIEIKSHKDVQRTDELELAFYWLLLEPSRTKGGEPRGILILRRDGHAEEVEVPIAEHRFREVRRLLTEIRAARRIGVRPRICGCPVCNSVRRDEILTAASEREDLTMIHGIGREYSAALEQMGITTWRDLLSCDSSIVCARMKTRGYFLSLRQVEYWRQHARSYATAKPVAFGDGAPIPPSYIAADLEYTPPHVWLIGLCTVREGRTEYRSLWADDQVSLRKNLEELGTVLAADPTFPLITWGGDGADIPRLTEAIYRFLPQAKTSGWEEPHPLAFSILDRHLDLYQYVWRNVRLPIPSLSLKEVSPYFGVPRVSNVADGLAAQMLYAVYRNARGSKKQSIQRQLLAYNQDDLEALIEVTGRVRDLMAAAEPVAFSNSPKLKPSRKISHDQTKNVERRSVGEVAWCHHLKSCSACWGAAAGQDIRAPFCSTGLALINRLG